MPRVLSLALLLALLPCPARAADPPPGAKLFDRSNLVVWCIVPFDAKKRGPEQRVAMLKQLGFTKYAYDWRAEHLPTFDREVGLLKESGIELTAVWFPANLGSDARALLNVIAWHKVRPQLWVTMGDPGGRDQAEKVANAAKVIRPIAEEAAKNGCKVALYNHGGWFGEPANLVAVVDHLKLPNVGIVYNLHHGHDHLPRFTESLAAMRPHLLALNLNGMEPDGEKRGKKILPLGAGSLDLKLLRDIAASGYAGPVGILGHTQDDAEARLLDNLDGLAWLRPQLAGTPAGPRPTYRTHTPRP
jgi:sugar phosphate isomerase/epimerase